MFQSLVGGVRRQRNADREPPRIGPQRPRSVSVQAEGCAPVVRAFDAGLDYAEPWQDAKTIAPGIRVPAVIADYLILDAVRSSNGSAIAVSDKAIAAIRTENTLLSRTGDDMIRSRSARA